MNKLYVLLLSLSLLFLFLYFLLSLSLSLSLSWLCLQILKNVARCLKSKWKIMKTVVGEMFVMVGEMLVNSLSSKLSLAVTSEIKY